MLIPQGMAYAVIAGMPPIYGLYAGVIPLLIYPIFGTSRHLSVGPVAVDMLIVGAGVGMLAKAESGAFIGLVILLSMMTGVLQLFMGGSRLGALFNFFSRPVIAGFTTSAPIIIAFSQLDNLLGMPLPDTQYVVIIASELMQNLDQIHLPSFYWGGTAIGALPVSGSFSRSAAAEQAGAKTPLANIVTASLIILTLLFLTDLFYYLPMPVLAAIIIVAVFGLIDIEEIKFLFKAKKSDGAIALYTFMCTLFIGIQEGILLGIGASMITLLYKYSRPAVAELGVIPDSRVFKNLQRNEQATRIDNILILRVDASFSFINADFFRDFILEKSNQQNDTTRFVVIDGSRTK